MMIRLDVPEGPDGVVTPHTYHQDQVRLGSGSENDVQLDEQGVQRHHATVEVREDQGSLIPGKGVTDLQVNGTGISKPTLLQPGDRLQIGPVEVLYKLVPFPIPEKNRRRSWLEWATLSLVVFGVAGQLFFLFIPAISLRQEIEPVRLIPTPTPEPIPTPDPSQVQVRPTPTPIPMVEAPEVEPDPVTDSSTSEEEPEVDLNALQSEADELLRNGDTLGAERKYREALREDPTFLPAKVALARLFSDQSNFAESLRFWEQVRREAPPGSFDAMDARLEIPSLKRKIERLEQEEQAPPIPDIESIPVPTAVPLRPAFPTPSAPVIEQASPLLIQDIRMERFPQSPRYDEFRILSFALAHQPGTPSVEAQSVKLRVTFFEQAGSRVRQADIPNPRLVLGVERSLSRGQRIEDLSAAYEVPTGRGRDGRSYYGAIIEVFIDGQEVHRAADPEFLLEFIR